MNDNDPIFKVSFYNATIPEDTRDGVFVTEVQATDKDTDAVQESITYKLAQETIGYFVIDTNTGIISTGNCSSSCCSTIMFYHFAHLLPV